MKKTGRTEQEKLMRRRGVSGFLDNTKLRTKIIILCITCVLIPVIGTSMVFWNMVYNAEQERVGSQMTDAYTNTTQALDNLYHALANMTATYYTDKDIYTFLDARYAGVGDFYNAYLSTIGTNGVIYGSDYINSVELYADNETIVNGGGVHRISSVSGSEWYKAFSREHKPSMICSYYDIQPHQSRKVISLVRSLDYSKYNQRRNKKILRLDVSYTFCRTMLIQQNSTTNVYICQDDKILFSNNDSPSTPFAAITDIDILKADRTFSYNMFGSEWKIYLFRADNSRTSVSQIIADRWPILIVLFLINLIVPFVAVCLVSASIRRRLKLLGTYMDMVKEEKFERINIPDTRDELGELINNYNMMSGKMRELIEDVYKARLSSQENELQKQRAELQALHSQINPHFMFNALESIRMRSIIKNENETADIIEMLAVMMRKSTDWGDDLVTVDNEINFAETYLKLQQYRFSERLSYRIELSPDCAMFRIPKLSIVTFVENACVHGVEGVGRNCIIIISVERDGDMLCIYIEDTGAGMSEEQSAAILREMRSATFDDLRYSKSIGIINACLRLKKSFGDEVQFDVDSEEGAGSCFTIRIPINKLN